MTSSPDYDSTGVEYHIIPKFTFSNGTTLSDVKVAYRSFNPSSTSGTVLIPTCFSGIINSTQYYTAAPNDCLAKYHVVVVAMLGNGESSSPSNKSFFPDPGELRYQDVVESQHHLLTEGLGVKQLEAVIGFSMGGQQAYHWGVMYPDFVSKVVPICSSARTSPHNYAFLEGPTAALTSSLDYVAWKTMKQKLASGDDVGPKLRELKPKQGLKAFSRAYGAWLTSHHWFRERLWSKMEGGMGCESVDAWLNVREAGYLAWDADDLLVLARMWQMGDIGTVIPGEELLSQHGGSVPDDEKYEKALKSIKAKVLVMPCKTDQYFPPDDGEIEVKHLQNGVFEPIPSIWGHMAGGGSQPQDAAWLNEKIGQFLGST